MTDDYNIQIQDQIITISGILRLKTPTSYIEPLKPIQELIEAQTPLTINIHQLEFLNSSGVTSIARLILNAKQYNCSLNVIYNENSFWQEKTIPSLKKLYPEMTISTQVPTETT